jgi:transposase InsO family protein
VAARLRAERPDQVWALDFRFDVTQDGRLLKLLHVVDEHTREALAIEVARRIDADRTVSVLERVVFEQRRCPAYLRMDNGPELTANALHDWCRFSGAGSSYIEPGSPWENPFVESFASRVRDEVLAVEAFDSLLEAKIVIEEWRNTYNTLRPHSSLGWKTPVAYAADWRTRPPRLS